MTAAKDKAGETGIDVAEATMPRRAANTPRAATRTPSRARSAAASGAFCVPLGFAVINELSLANGRRADVVGLSPAGDIWIVEVKSCLDDLRVDSKWPEYRDFSDALFFAVAPGLPVDILPADTGLILADRFGGEIVRPAPETRLAAARRKAMTLRFARAAAFSLQALADPGLENS